MDYNQYSHKVLTSLVLVPNPIVYSIIPRQPWKEDYQQIYDSTIIIAAIKRPVKEDYSTTIGKA